MKKKLIEVALPLDAINAASAREKSIRHGHPSTLHLWWARRPLATARAVLFASLVDDPSSRPEEFPTKEAQDAERQRLFRLIEKMVVWENSGDKGLFAEAYEEIKKSTGGNPPPVFDPFAGGGTIPLEAQRLGLKAIAADLNPVAVMINKAMIEIPARFQNMPPVNPEAKNLVDAEYTGAQGLAADIAYYGKLLKERAFEKIGHLYPKVKVPGTNQEATVIAWIWARTVKCPNPACGREMPLVKSFVLSKKKGHETYVKPVINGKKIRYEVRHGKGKAQEGTIGRTGATCICCGASVPISYIRDEAKAGRLHEELMAIVAEQIKGRLYLAPDAMQKKKAQVEKPKDYPDAELPNNPRWFSPPAFGLTHYSQLFTNRQLTALTTFSDLIDEIRSLAYHDAENNGAFDGDKKELADGGTGAWAYGQAIAVYLAFALDRQANYSSSLNAWSGDFIVQTFGRQALPMVWDYAETNIFSNSTGNWDGAIKWIMLAMNTVPCQKEATVIQHTAQEDNGLRDVMISTDPPYYDNIGYADLSDYFYLWLRRSLHKFYPSIFSTMQVPKQAELIATPYRFDGSKQKAKTFFEEGMAEVCRQLYQYTQDAIPVTIYYAFKQSDLDSDGMASSGWETMLSAIITAGFVITGTWPIHTERETGLKAHVNALASSIVLVCRKRETTTSVCTRKNFLRELKKELETSLAHLQASNIAPVDMAQSAIGPGISVYSRYEKVLEADGSPMTVRSALKLINQALDEYFHGQGENLDAESRFCIDFYTTYGFGEAAFGEADVLARAKNVAMNRMAESGAVVAAKGKVRLAKPEELPEDGKTRNSWIRVQRLVRCLADSGIKVCAASLQDYLGDTESLKNLAYRLYQIADKKGWAQDGTGYNNLVISWQDILEQRETLRREAPEQGGLFEGAEG